MSETSANTPLDDLLHRLNDGDLLAAEEVFVKFAPFLRMIVRRQISGRLHAKFDSSDIVQSIWADLLVGFREGRWHFSDAGHLQAFLVKATQNRFLDRVRRQRPVLDHERTLTAVDEDTLTPANAARASQEVRVDELWHEMLRTCTPEHREILELKRQGKSLAEIAAQTKYHESSVRRILYDVARGFATKPRGQSTDEVA